MENSQIHQLLAKYFEGNTTLDEERILHSYFSSEEKMDAQWLPLKKHFALLDSGKTLPFDQNALISGILDGIDHYEKKISPPVKKINLSRFLIAASIALMVTLAGIFYFKSSNRIRDTYTDPQLAYIETQKALLYVSQKMNKGMEPLSNISKINSGTQQLKKLEKMDKSLGMLNLVSFINQSSNLKK